MKTIMFLGAAALTAAATPAFANEARVEARGGVIWGGGDSEAIAGVAAGYDFDLGDRMFIGGEVSADKVLTDDTRVSFGFGGRIGAKIGDAGKLYAISTYQTKFVKDFCANIGGGEGGGQVVCVEGDDAVTLGAGYQHNFGRFFAKAEYRHYFVDGTDANAATVGLGARF